MKKIIIATISIVGALALATPVIARTHYGTLSGNTMLEAPPATTAPEDAREVTVILSQTNQENVWNLSKNGKTYKIFVRDCIINPDINVFQEVSVMMENFIVEKRLYDYVVQYSDIDWYSAMAELKNQNRLCDITYLR